MRDTANNIVPGITWAWTSRAPVVASVSSTGLVTALSAGSTLITASVAGRSGTVTITVSENAGIYSETPPFFHPDVETFFGTSVGTGAFFGGFVEDSVTKREGAASRRMTVRSSGNGFAGWFAAWGDTTHYADETLTRDMVKYAGGSVHFSTLSPVDLEVGIRSGNVAAGSETSKTLLSRVGFIPGPNWQQLCVPLASFTGASPLADLSRIKILFLIATSKNSGVTGGISVSFWVDDVRWDTRPW